MQKVWFRKQTGWWYASIKEDGTYGQLKLVKAPHTREGRKLAERRLVEELAAKQHAEDTADTPEVVGWVTVGHVIAAFLKHSREEHEPATARWYADLLTPFRDLWGKLRATRLRKMHVRAWLKSKEYNPTSANRALGAAKRAFNWAVEENSSRRTRSPTSGRRRRSFASEP